MNKSRRRMLSDEVKRKRLLDFVFGDPIRDIIREASESVENAELLLVETLDGYNPFAVALMTKGRPVPIRVYREDGTQFEASITHLPLVRPASLDLGTNREYESNSVMSFSDTETPEDSWSLSASDGDTEGASQETEFRIEGQPDDVRILNAEFFESNQTCEQLAALDPNELHQIVDDNLTEIGTVREGNIITCDGDGSHASKGKAKSALRVEKKTKKPQGVVAAALKTKWDDDESWNAFAKIRCAQEAFTTIVKINQRYVFSYFRKRNLELAVCEDLTQETFLGLWNRSDENFERRASFRTVLISHFARPVASAYFDKINATKRGGGQRALEYDERLDARSVVGDAESRLESTETNELLTEAIQHLEEGLQRIICMKYFADVDYSAKDIAQAMGWSERQVGRKLEQARIKMRTFLESKSIDKTMIR